MNPCQSLDESRRYSSTGPIEGFVFSIISQLPMMVVPRRDFRASNDWAGLLVHAVSIVRIIGTIRFILFFVPER